jgi:hypothetical protein
MIFLVDEMRFIIDKQSEEANKGKILEIINTDFPIKISVYDMIKKLEKYEELSKKLEQYERICDTPEDTIFQEDLYDETSSSYSRETTSSNNSNTTISSISSEDFITVDGITRYKDEVEDEYLQMNDKELIIDAENILKQSKKYGIEEHYRKNNLKYRPFNLGGLYSKRHGIKSEKQRYMIRELLRTCIKYLESDTVKNKKKVIRKNIEDKEIELDKKNKEIKKLEEPPDYDLDYDKECCYIFKRHELKGKKCTNYCIKGKNYCPICQIKF